MGTPEFSIPALQLLNLEHEIKSVYTQPPKKKSRGQKMIKSPIHLEAEKLKIPVRFPEDLNNESDYEFIKSADVNFVIVAAYFTLLVHELGHVWMCQIYIHRGQARVQARRPRYYIHCSLLLRAAV